MLNATWLETFTVLCETGHFTQAARKLAMTQPGVSQQLRKLEHQMGQSLIAQHGKTFSLTPAGEAVFALGQQRRREERQLREMIEADDPGKGAAHLACSGGFAMMLYPKLAPLMQASHELEIHLHAAPEATVLTGVLDGQFDLGLLSHDPDHPRLSANLIGREELCLILPAADMPEGVTFAGLEARGFIAHPDGFAYANDLFSLNFPDEFQGADRLRLRGYLNQMSQIPAPVADGAGYTLLPRSGVDAFRQPERLAVASLPRQIHHELWLVQRRSRPLSARLQALASVMRELARNLSEK
ncbi:LysR family transcriptional regulator [Henriciella marina]|uniref:LysR family transcriptional regulator n=1 Tax=Henriciella marina TaxID=453851 RepID=A0ABT4LWY7_9PROT|nr:LysR family transcriptional regulator [Henriciella marina]MCZ4298038.1 LysR family transcriptional regulator [Henriciella marina]